jgi:hypothetical protein
MIENILLNQQLGSLGPFNFLKHSLKVAVEYGVSPEALVLLLILPLLATLIALSRYLLGVKGPGLFTPIMLSVAFLMAGLEAGFFMFLIILGTATLVRLSIRKLKIHYLSRMAFLIWFLSLVTLGGLVWFKVPIFALLLLILLTENFIEAQIGKNLRNAIKMTIETLVLAVSGMFLLSWQPLRLFAISQPEILVFSIFILNILVGRFTGLRLTEYKRFKKIFEK